MKYIRSRIIRLVEEKSITNKEEKEKLEHLIKNKKWNPYCIRYSAITSILAIIILKTSFYDNKLICL